MSTWLRQIWWLAIAAILGSILIVFGIGLPFTDGTTGALVGGILITASGAAILAGIAVRRQRRVAGDVLIAVGTLPCYPFFWSIFLPVLGLLVLIPALVDVGHAAGTENGPAGQQPLVPASSNDWLLAALVAVTIAATAVAAVAGSALGAVIGGVLVFITLGYRMSRGRARSA